MKKKLTLWILLLPFALMAQTGVKNGAFTIDFGHKKKQNQTDTTKTDQTPGDDEDEQAPKPKKEKKQANGSNDKQTNQDYDYKKDGLFQGLFVVGMNGCQVDGDGFAGYKYLGLEANVGAMIRFHKYLAASMEIGYTMKGAKEALIPSSAPISPMLYRSQYDYIQIPLALSVVDKQIVMFSIGVAPSILIRYTERNSNGEDITNANPFGAGDPRRFDLPLFGALHFIIKGHFALGFKFSYSTIPIKASYNFPTLSPTKLLGQYHNVFTVRFMYILNATSKKKS